MALSVRSTSSALAGLTLAVDVIVDLMNLAPRQVLSALPSLASNGCRPPSWLWDFEGEDEEELDESVAHIIRTQSDFAAIKAEFEEAVGPEYLRYAYTPEYRIARNICRLAITGFHSNEEYEMAQDTIGEWNALMPQSKVGGIFVVDNE
ncbi:hypothetical protein NX059_004197 [Plenodomus lindquistii]|nr:hypothetical protein NX059_004197 [Plenodomus lindquistii]